MALALLPAHHADRILHNSLPFPNISLATARMEQETKTRPSLPSISSLISAVTENSDKRNDPTPKIDTSRRVSAGSQGNRVSPDRPRVSESPRNLPPPTPELPPASSFDFPRPSPTNVSPTAVSGRSNYYPTIATSTNPEIYTQRMSTYPQNANGTTAYSPISDNSHWSPAALNRPTTDAVQDHVGRPPQSSYIEARRDSIGYNGLAHQRPLPVNFPPPIPGPGLPPIETQITPTWQHHHYYPPANPPAYPQTQERYICPTCNKPFSRPSSLKIHTYSHTGEKPYKCKHEGCGKYFSVRSNMKRHEKGCHGGATSNAPGTSPKTG